MNLDSPVLRFLILLITGLALYAPVFDGQWVFDDERLVSGHEWLWRDVSGPAEELQEWSTVLEAGPREGDEVRTGFRPIRFFSYRIDVLILKSFGIDSPDHPSAPIPFHVHNLLLHVLCAWILSSILGRIFPWTRNGIHLAVAAIGVAPAADRVKTFQGKSEGIDFAMAAVAGRLIAVCRQLIL